MQTNRSAPRRFSFATKRVHGFMPNPTHHFLLRFDRSVGKYNGPAVYYVFPPLSDADRRILLDCFGPE